LKKEGVESPVILTRAGWAGMQTTGAVLWSSDIPSSFESLNVQVRAGLSTMMSGIPVSPHAQSTAGRDIYHPSEDSRSKQSQL